MTWLVTALLAICLIMPAVASAEPLTPARGDGLPRWTWSTPTGSQDKLRIELVRADVDIVAAKDGRTMVRIEAQGASDDAARVWIDATRSPDGYILSDRYPQRPPWTMYAECLPPSNTRGDFWVVQTRFKVTLAVPPGATPFVMVMSGIVRDLRDSR